MTVKQKLYPQKIYQVNRAIDEFKKECGLGNQFIGFCALNYYNRKFSWYVVDKERWVFTNIMVNNIKACCKKHVKKWEEFLIQLKVLDNEALKESIKYFDEIIHSTSRISESSEKFHFHFLNIYQSYPIASDKFFDGIIYRNIKKKNMKLKYATAEILSKSNECHDIYPWLDITFYYEDEEGDEVIKSFSCQEWEKEGCDIEYNNSLNKEVKKEKIEKLGEFQHTYAETVYYHYLLPIMAGYPHPDHNEKYELYDGKYNNDEYLLKQEHIRQQKFLLFIPVYDARIGKNLFGNFYGNITILFETKNNRKQFLKKYQRKIEENLFLLIR